MKKVLGIALSAVLFLLPLRLISEAQASPLCGDRAKVLANLAEKYGEAPVAVGVTSNGGVIELLKAPDGLTWTIIYTYPSGPSCLVASGEAWQEIAPKIKGPAA